MKRKTILSPPEKYLKLVILGLIVLITGSLALGFIIYESVFEYLKHGRFTLLKSRLFLIIMLGVAILASYFKLQNSANRVIISEKGITKPSLIRTLFNNVEKEYILVKDISSYEVRKIEGDHTKIKGIKIETEMGEEIYYSEDATPGCTEKIQRYLENNGVNGNKN